MQECEESIEIYVFFDETAAETPILNILLVIHRTYMAQNVLVVLTRIFALTVGDHSMHPELGVLALFDEMGPHCGSHHVSYKGSSFW